MSTPITMHPRPSHEEGQEHEHMEQEQYSHSHAHAETVPVHIPTPHPQNLPNGMHGLQGLGNLSNPFAAAQTWIDTIQGYANENPGLVALLGLGLVYFASQAPQGQTRKGMGRTTNGGR